MFTLQNIKKSYDNEPVLTNISATFEAGNCYLILGENGAGKSTLIKIIAGDESFDSGTIRTSQTQNIEEAVALQYQSFESYSFLKVREVIRLFAKLIDKPVDLQVLYELLEIDTYQETLIKNTSGGQRKALSLYLAFLLNKPIILLDEPFADLDLQKKNRLVAYLMKQTKVAQKCLLIISHEIKGFEPLFDRVLVMKNGNFIEVGTIEQLVQKYPNPTFQGLEGVYFEVTGQVLGGRVQ